MFKPNTDKYMNRISFSRGLVFLFVVILVSSFTFELPAKRFSPVGSWDYSVPGVAEGYETGTMIITRDRKEYRVTMQLTEYSKVEAEQVVYKNKTISFSFWVETEEILVSGTFDGENFNAKLSYSEGDFNLEALKKPAE